MNDSEIQKVNLERVKSKIAPIIVEFFEDRVAGFEFHMGELQRYVGAKAQVSPDSPSRILRDLRKKGILDYEIISRPKSHYRFNGFTRPNSLQQLGFFSLDEYHVCDHWVNFRTDYFSRKPNVCFVSGLRRNLDLHHITYVRLGCELDEDVVPLQRFWHKFVHHLVKQYKVKLEVAHLVARDSFKARDGIESLYPSVCNERMVY